MSAAPKLTELQALATATIEADAFVVAGSIPVVEHRGLEDPKVESHIRKVGVCVVVCPLVKWKRRDQSGPAWLVDAELLVKVRVNPKVNDDAEAGGGQVDIYALCSAVTSAMTTAKRHPGGEFFRIGEEAGILSEFDPGLWSYDLIFTKEAIL